MAREIAISRAKGESALTDRDTENAVVELEIERTREKILESIQRLRGEVTDAIDWRKQYARRPWAFLAGALGLGVLLGLTRRMGREIRS